MEHIALYRAWRPQSFQDMVGQQHIIQTLQNAIREQRVSHAYLFSGPRGTGKTSAAKVLAKAVNCERGPGPEPCNECPSCLRITSGNIMDVQEIDAASNRGVEEIRDLRDKVKYAPTEVRRKVYIIDEVHMLTTEAFNALLKTLEEPPPHVMFILATTEPHKLPATIISRCQRFDFRRVSLEEQSGRLAEICQKEGITADADALQYIARLSDGGMRDALSILDQISSFTDGQVTYQQVLGMTGGIPSEQFAKLATAILEGDMGRLLELVEQLMQEGKSADKCLENLLYYFRDLLMIKMVPGADKLTDRVLNPAEFRDMANGFSRERLFQIVETLNRYLGEMKYATHPQTLFEVALMKLCTMQQETVPPLTASSSAADALRRPAAGGQPAAAGELEALKRQIAALEKKLEQAIQAGGLSGGGRDQGAGQRQTPAASPAPRVSSSSKLPPQLDKFIASKDSSDSNAVYKQWSTVLQAVKEERVTVHAWFVDGEPVSVLDDAVLVAFKNTIHRDTTEKPANRQVIENVFASRLGKPYRLVTMMLRDWNEASQKSAAKPGSEELRLEHEHDAAEDKSEPWIDEAIQLFGEDLVVIKE
ncbi:MULTISPECIES: DNA polymerase III subunit gamma/tau [unclassified Paenibacillus]|uniref:DNA polymerase III subunit gamma/tau n=1 Tax=unclassified Paenibacillus TaxID=185978 RepID=UPI0024077661|nr:MULTISPECIES: DNA polymerase III subunit gamma/tau [unclassified Paenibacillus]MDF9844910.1 DNA polymerase-3 subunit gamma/tau [Paenibacillus sp. PastF-2]MDF9851509.1 DNA polymerase-3 subunit gamma/tau [Paenibacillus sp. PastM-2]MDF9858093.1 DNA polymerase-3 subunit gamma/tau [Paenibacillus sp. PastF-1]MDH6483320.1 DNA polymerase-3 subunit gamma/tau [Paenibacillus sp. PastH-2]MDH6510729.1 DNA polymerase-3 subunit gamma/tau [Paenibacillus sp. PastM-3]